MGHMRHEDLSTAVVGGASEVGTHGVLGSGCDD